MKVKRGGEEMFPKLLKKDKRKSKASVRWKFSNLSKMKNNCFQRTNTFYLENLPWTIKVQRRLTGKALDFGFFVECLCSAVDKTGGQFAKGKLRLLSQKTGQKYVEKEFNHLFHSLENDWGYGKFLKWEEVLNPAQGYIKDDSVTVEVDLETDAPDDAPKAFFSFTFDNISTLNSVRYSSPFYAESMPWVIKIVPKSRKTFRFYLQCNEEGEFWSCFANANLFLLSHNSEQDYFNKKIEHLFSSKKNEVDFGNFIDWPVVFDPDEDYIKNDSLILKIYFDVDSPNGESYNSELCITRTEYTFRFTIDNVSKMKDSKLSEPVYVGQLPWMIKVAPLSGQNEKMSIEFLGVFLQCNEEGEFWKCYADAELRLLSYRREQECFTRKIKHQFCSESKDWGFNRFMKWHDVLNPVKGYIKDDSITVEVHLIVKDEPEND